MSHNWTASAYRKFGYIIAEIDCRLIASDRHLGYQLVINGLGRSLTDRIYTPALAFTRRADIQIACTRTMYDDRTSAAAAAHAADGTVLRQQRNGATRSRV